MAGKPVELLLIENIDNLGIVGDVVQVKPGYARNYLVPMGLATSPSPEAIKAVEARCAEVERQLREQRDQQERLIAAIEGHELTLQRSANEQGVLFGSVNQHDITVALQEDGFAVVERDVRIGEPIKRLDAYEVPIQLADDLKTQIKVWVVSDKPLDGDAATGADGEVPEDVEGLTTPAGASADADDEAPDDDER